MGQSSGDPSKPSPAMKLRPGIGTKDAHAFCIKGADLSSWNERPPFRWRFRLLGGETTSSCWRCKPLALAKETDRDWSRGAIDSPNAARYCKQGGCLGTRWGD